MTKDEIKAIEKLKHARATVSAAEADEGLNSQAAVDARAALLAIEAEYLATATPEQRKHTGHDDPVP